MNYEKAPESRELPELSLAPTWEEVLHRAFLANGDLEAAYFTWKAAVERIDIAAAYPNTRLMLGYSYTFSSENMKAFDRSTFSFNPDAMQNLMWPSKVMQQGRVALDEAQTAGARFRAAKFDLQRRALTAWADFTLAEERVRVQHEQLELARLAVGAARARVGGGGMQQDLLKSEVTLGTAEDGARTAEADLASARATLNALLARGPSEPLESRGVMPALRSIPVDDATLLGTAANLNPELEALAHQVQGRSDALELARLQWLPDINPMFAFTGSVSQTVGAAIALPTTIPQIEGAIKESSAMLRGAEATLRQARSDRAGTFVATLLTLRNAERQAALFETRIVPATERLVSITRQSYAAGGAGYLDMIESRRALLDARLTLAEAKASREKRLAELEALMGIDVETLAPHTPELSGTTVSQAATRPVQGVAP